MKDNYLSDSNISVLIADDEDGIRCIEAGAKDFIIKPFDNKKFIEKIKKVLGAEWKNQKN